jgi:hypothetical protein
MNQKHIEDSLAKIRTIFEQASATIEALKPGEKIAATTLADNIAKTYGMTGPQLYPTLKFLFDKYPGVDIKKGAHGGIIKHAAPVAVPVVTVVPSGDSQ